MTNHDNSLKERQAYHTAFHIGWVGSILLAVYTLLGRTMAGLLALAAWSQVTLFILPWIYLWLCKTDLPLSRSSILGPHQ